jgi:hypothetical protein
MTHRKIPKQGAVYFTSSDIIECREFLRGAGLKGTIHGWQSRTRLGAIYFAGGSWTAAYWDRHGAAALAVVPLC